ncbi:uncharacterized protein [Leptinotarsa decemlineata]|uniref:uncharacterized protein n=1 Tax=Leptinotarsa decemlineata TaxID=7539 RepID=UPI003D30983C
MSGATKKGPCRIPTFGSRIPQIQPLPGAAVSSEITTKHLGRRVRAGEKEGILRFVGNVNFAKGSWCGIELNAPIGKNDGSVNGVRYFACSNRRGLMAPLSKVALVDGSCDSLSDNSSGPYSMLFIQPKVGKTEYALARAASQEALSNETFCKRAAEATFAIARDRTFDSKGNTNNTVVVNKDFGNQTVIKSRAEDNRSKFSEASKKRTNQTFDIPNPADTTITKEDEQSGTAVDLTFSPIKGSCENLCSGEVKRRKTSSSATETAPSKPSSLPQLQSVLAATPLELKKFTFSTPVQSEFKEPFIVKQRIIDIQANDESSKRDSLEFDESLGILTPDQMMNSIQFLGTQTRSPSLEYDVNLSDCFKNAVKSELSSPRVESLELDEERVKIEPKVEAVIEEEVPNPLNKTGEFTPPNLNLGFKTPGIDNFPVKELKDEVLSPILTDYSLGIIDEQIFSNRTDTTMNMELPLDSVGRTVLTRLDQTPSPEELPLDPMPAVESEPKTEPSKSKTSNSFVTSITSITSLDTGYQGDGEMSRPASRCADNSPLTRRPLPRPQARRPDPMTDSDFYTESDADNHEENHLRGDRRAQVIDGTLYGVDPQAAADIYMNNRENMDSSGIFTDIESNPRNEEALEAPDASPSDTSTKTISENSQDNLQEVLDKTIENKELDKAKDNPKKRNAPSSGILSPSSLSSPRHLKEENVAKKYKMPKRDVASKVKAMLEPSRVPTADKKPSKKPAGRWDAVMNKISKSDQSKANLKEVKSKVFSEVNVNTGVGQRQDTSRKPINRSIGSQKSPNNKICTTPVKRPGSAQSLPSSEKRRIRNRPNGGSTPKSVGTRNMESSIHSSLSDLSAATLPPSNKTPGSAKKTCRCGSSNTSADCQ